MLESSSDAVTQRVAAGILGLILLTGYAVVRRRARRRGPVLAALTVDYFPAIAAACSGTAAIGLIVARIAGLPLAVPPGPGSYLSGAIAGLAVALAYASRARSAVRRAAR